MSYKETGNLTEEQFLRLTGVKRPVFEQILSILYTRAHLEKSVRRLPQYLKRRKHHDDGVEIASGIPRLFSHR
jgi:hypothetical protein